MKKWVNAAGVAALTALMANSAPAHTPTQTDELPLVRDGASLSVMTYNVHGLPWPVASDRTDDLHQIGDRLAQLRRRGLAPDVVVIQEAFTEDAKAIAQRSGYRFVAYGNAKAAVQGAGPKGASWWKGEGLGPTLDSGLMLLSDRPIDNVRRMAFAAADCAGYDCLAAKGVLVATVRTRSGQAIDVATTHLNSRSASGVDHDRSRAAWRRQLATVARLVGLRQASGNPLILTGDFNVGKDDGRQSGFARTWGFGNAHGQGLDALRELRRQGRLLHVDLHYVMQRGKDWSIGIDGALGSAQPVAATVVFGRNSDDHPLSDHIGFAITYRIAPRPAA